MTAAPHARARRLLRWYPARWRARYGEEFAELLTAEIAERPWSWRRTADVAAAGLRARLAAAGLAGFPVDQAAARRAALAATACCAAAFAALGGSMWSQVAIGLQWTTPPDHAVPLAFALMSAGLLTLAVLALLAAAPVAAAAWSLAASGRGRALAGPGALTAAGLAVLVIGGRHFGNGWPGTGGHLLPHQELVPGGVAAFCWAATLWVTSYWLHPAALAAFPAAELTWLAISPAAVGAVVTGVLRVLARIELSPRALRCEMVLGSVALAGMAAFLLGAVLWVTSAPAALPALLHAGLIDRAALAALTLAGAVTLAAARRMRGPAIGAGR
ncbi:MAG: hypothetical protein M0030_09350 [Actinomycetota bacterium]|nr:hypothetical protein [Actinomycetota bacterium]